MHVTFAQARKAVVAVLGALALLVSQGILTGTAAHVAASVLAVATALGVFVTPNAAKAASTGGGV